jgi:hypothetical protein
MISSPPTTHSSSTSAARRRNVTAGSGIAGRSTNTNTKKLSVVELAARARMWAIIKRAAIILVPIILFLVILSWWGVSPVYLGMRATHGVMSARTRMSNVRPVHGVTPSYMAFVNLAAYWSSYSQWNHLQGNR